MKYDLLDEILYTVAEKWSHSTLVQSKRRKIRRSADINELTGTNLKEKIWLQVECHPFLNQAKLKDFCAERGVLLTAYSPLGSPGTEGSTLGLLQNPEIQALATKYGKSTAQILIRYQIERGVVVIPKSVHKNRILENFDVFDFQMSAEDVAAIDGLNTNLRFLDWLKGCPGYSFGIEF